MWGTPITLSINPNSIDMNPTGTHLYIANNSNSVYKVRTADLAVTLIPVGDDTSGIDVHPSGSYIYAAGQTSVHVIDTATNAVLTSIPLGGTNSKTVSFNTDGTRVYVPISGTAEAKVIDTGSHSVIDTIVAGNNFNITYGSFVASHRHVWSGTMSFPIKFTGLGADGKFVKGAGELTGRVIEMRTLGGTPESRYSLLFLTTT